MSRGRAHGRTLGRCLTVWLVATLAAVLLLARLLPHAVASLQRPPRAFDGLLVGGCELAASVTAGWLWVLVTLVVRDVLRGRSRPAATRVPAVVRRLVLAGCGLSLAGGVLVPAHAHTADPDRAVAETLVGLPVPDRMSTTRWLRGVRRAALVHTGSPGPGAPHRVVVSPGDTLWGLAAATLPPTAPAAEVDRRWREIYRANADAIGADPHLIRPGQRLLVPGRARVREE